MRTAKEMAALRERVIQLRRQGKSRRQIKEVLGIIGNSTLDRLLQAEPLPPERGAAGCEGGERLPPERAGPGCAESRARAAEGVRRYWAAQRPAREAARAAIS